MMPDAAATPLSTSTPLLLLKRGKFPAVNGAVPKMKVPEAADGIDTILPLTTRSRPCATAPPKF